MADVFSKEKRSEVMSKIRSENTNVEKIVFKELRKRKVYFQKHYRKVVGTPDIALPRKKLAIFIDGDFWHGKDFKKIKKRLSTKFWVEKIKRNIKRDRDIDYRLYSSGWKVLRIWEYDIYHDFENMLIRIIQFLNNITET